MKKTIRLFKFSAILSGILIFNSCSKDDSEDKIPTFSEADMSAIHGNDEKSWKITEVVNKYADPSDDLHIEVDCLSDDIYTFSADSDEASITFGDNLCFEDVDDGIFKADHESFGARLLMLGTPETIYMSFGRGYVNEDNTAFASTFAYYALAELSENRMVFYKSNTGIKGDYYEAYIFEAIE